MRRRALCEPSSERTPTSLPVEITCGDDETRRSGVVRDASIGVAFIQTDAPAAFGSRVFVHLTSPATGIELRLPAVVRWKCADGVGVQFGLLGTDATEAILDRQRHRAA